MNQKLLLFLFFIQFTVFAQKIRVYESGTLSPISHVDIYNFDGKKYVYTNDKGYADITEFQEQDTLFFNHINYDEFQIIKKDINLHNPAIYLHKKSEQLNEIILSASRGKLSRDEVAEQVVIATRFEIEKLTPQSSADLLDKLPGVKVQKSQFGGGSPVIRGLEANRVLLVVDGIRMNNAIYRTGHLQNSITIAPSVLERTEILFGPSSVLYGSDALGGVVHYYTKKPRTSDNKFKYKAGVFSRFGSVNEEFTNHFNLELQHKKFATFTSFTHSKFGDLRMGKNRNHDFDDWGLVKDYSQNTDTYYTENPSLNNDSHIQKNTGYSQTDFIQKIFIPFSERTNVTVNFQYSKSSDIPRFDKLAEYSKGELKFAEWYYGPQERFLTALQFEITPEKEYMKSGTITLAYQNINESRVQRKFSSLKRAYRDENVDVFSLNGDFFLPLFNSKKQNLAYGFEVTHNDVGSDSYGRTLDVAGNSIIGYGDNFVVQSRYPDGGSTYSTAAVYLDYRKDYNKKSTLNMGVRFTGTSLSAKWEDDTYIQLPDNDITLNNAAVTATVGYVYKPFENIQFNSRLSSGFRSPNVDDIGKIREKSGRVSVPNIHLKPEYAYTGEIGILKYLNKKNIVIGANVYYTLLDDYITREDFSLNDSPTILYDDEEVVTYANVNKGSAFIAGGTLTVKGIIKGNWNTNASLTYTKGKTYDTDTPLSSIPPLFGNVGFGYNNGKLDTSLNCRFNAKKNVSDYNLIEGIDNVEQTPVINENAEEDIDKYYGSPSWMTFNFYSKYGLTKNIDLQLNVENIFDIHYKEFASGISSPGRNFILSAYFNI
ncbi:TonB-dependent receptor plug domain-containing protein [Aureivirga sp. CE67]|uniref:TonB-dependent receptor plug domain-containing protein n=1 Tax=Aureivirga sp. CE67 TaxID=1788983 RepID=UPI0018C9AC2D|nr:TonB-dependent receptor [Aureivirga sp. CE67]